MYKFSKILTCACQYRHIIQGPASCWACMQKLDTVPQTVARQVYQDLQAMRWSQDRNQFDTNRSLNQDQYAKGWPDDAGMGRENRFGFAGMPDDRNVNKNMSRG